MTSVGTTQRQLKRHSQVVRVLVKYGFGQLLDEIRLWEHMNIQRRVLHHNGRDFAHLTRDQRVRLALEELGPTFVKLGQLLSTRPDLVPHELISELEQLQNHVAPFPSKVARDIVQSELGRSLEEVFASFEDEPVAAASLSQVHHATLKEGETVAVKIQRPGIEDLIEVDLEIMHTLATLMENHLDAVRLINPVELAREFSNHIKKELSFRAEANNMVRYAHNFADNPHIHIPEVYLEMCTERVLVMEYICGINISEIEKLVVEGYDLSLIASRGAEIALKSTLEYGFFHADPHPGNILILPDNAICLLDFGMMGTLSPHDRDSLVKLADNIINRDAKGATRALLELAQRQGVVHTEELEMDVSNLIQEYAYLQLRELRLGDVLNQLLQLLRTHGLRFPTHLVWLLKAIATVENIARQLDPYFNMAQYAEPYAQRLLIRRLSPLQHIRELRTTAMELLDSAKELPYETRDILRQLKDGQLKIEFEHVGLEPMRRTMNRISNRMTIAIILAALLVGSSLLVLSGLPPLVSGIPVIGLTGYLIAGVLCIWLVVSILRSGRT